MARSKSTTGEKTTHSRASGKTKKEEQLVEAGSPAGSNAHTAAAQTDSSVTPAAAESALAPQTRPLQPAHESNSPEPRKLGVVRPEVRKNVVVPINLEDEIRRRAYELYQQRGSGAGSEAEDWLAAEREVRERYQRQQQSA